MLFFENEKILGLVFWIVAVVFIMDSFIIMLAPFGFITVDIPQGTDIMIYCLVTGAGCLVAALLYAWNAHRVMVGKVAGSVQILSQYVMIVGLTTMIMLCADAVGTIVAYGSLDEGMIKIVAAVIFYIVLIAVAYKIGRGKKGLLKEFLWAILIIAFVLMAVFNVLPVESYEELASSIAHLIIAIFMLLFLLDTGVREEMGFKPRRV